MGISEMFLAARLSPKPAYLKIGSDVSQEIIEDCEETHT